MVSSLGLSPTLGKFQTSILATKAMSKQLFITFLSPGCLFTGHVQGVLYIMVCSIILYSSKFSRSINLAIFVKGKLITKILFTKNFSPMGVSIGAAMNHGNCCQ